MNSYGKAEKAIEIIAIVSIILCSIGIIGNIVTIIICLRKQLRKTPTFILIVLKAGTNILPLIAIFIPFVTGFAIKHNMLHFNLMCKVILFLSFWGCQSSAYLLV